MTLTIMTHDYDSQDMVSPNYGHHDCAILYPLYNLDYKHRTGTLPNYKSVTLLYWSYLVMKKYMLLWKKKIPQLRCCTIEKHLTQSYTEIFYLEPLPFWVTPKNTAISYLSFTAWWLNKQDNNNNNMLWGRFWSAGFPSLPVVPGAAK